MIGLVFAVQAGLIFLLNDKSRAHQRSTGAVPSFRLAGPGSAELLALNDPTLFALPHRQGFSGAGWLRAPAHKFPSFEWSDEPRWLRVPLPQLGQAFSRFMQKSESVSAETLAETDPELRLSQIPVPTVLRPQSTFYVQGELALRRLVSSPELPSWTHPDMLTNTVVRLVVNPEGQVVSAIVLKPSGFDEADKHALRQAKAARFESIVSSGPKTSAHLSLPLTSGEMIFEWHTSPATPKGSPN
jgi:TonB family protein